jgi:hypothetical protein
MANTVAYPKPDVPERPTKAGDREVTWIVGRFDDFGRASPESIWKRLNSHTSRIRRSDWLKNVDLAPLKRGRKGMDWTRLDVRALDRTWILPNEVEPFEYGRKASSTSGFASATG